MGVRGGATTDQHKVHDKQHSTLVWEGGGGPSFSFSKFTSCVVSFKMRGGPHYLFVCQNELPEKYLQYLSSFQC